MKKVILVFGGISISIFLLFELSKLSWTNSESFSNLMIIVTGSLFISIGFLINRYMSHSPATLKTQTANKKQLDRTTVTDQELRVLTLMAEGYSNTQIANTLFISENTVKTHVSRIFAKLNAKRRTEAVKIGRDLHII